MAASVLIVADDAHMASLVTMLLEMSGFDVRVCEDGRRALADSAAAEPDAIILDFDLPEMAGLEILRRLREDERLKRVPVVILTGSQDDLGELLRFDGACFLRKPFDNARIVGAVRRACRP